jgi:DNA-binding CsgD family transcriptional regulator
LLSGNPRRSLVSVVFYLGVTGSFDSIIGFFFLSTGNNWFRYENIYGFRFFYPWRFGLGCIDVVWAWLYYRITRKLPDKLPWGIAIAGLLPAAASEALLYPLLSAAGTNGATPAYVPVFGMITACLFAMFNIIVFFLYVRLRAAYPPDAHQPQVDQAVPSLPHAYPVREDAGPAGQTSPQKPRVIDPAQTPSQAPPLWTREAGISGGFISKFNITKREDEVITLILQGKTNKEIAVALNVTVETAKMHTKNIYRKTGVSGRFALQSLLRP